MPLSSCTPFNPGVLMSSGYLDHTKKLLRKKLQFYPLSKPTSKKATETNGFHMNKN